MQVTKNEKIKIMQKDSKTFNTKRIDNMKTCSSLGVICYSDAATPVKSPNK